MADVAAAEPEELAAGFSSEAWDPENKAYGIFSMLQCRAAMGEEHSKPLEVSHLKFVALAPAAADEEEEAADDGAAAGGATVAEGFISGGQRLQLEQNELHGQASSASVAGTAATAAAGAAAAAASAAPSGSRPPAAAGAAAAGGSAAGGGEAGGLATAARTEVVPELSRLGAWWRVCEEAVIRDGSSVLSTELRRAKRGEWLQQAGPALRLAEGKARGLIRLPVAASDPGGAAGGASGSRDGAAVGWATLDARAAGGPRILEPAPRWRATWTSGARYGDVLVRREVAMDSQPVAMLRAGDVVEQAGEPETLPEGVVRLRVALPETALPPLEADGERPLADVGWISLDATAAGGPVFFERL